MKYAATIGMFDGVHRGHLCLIGQMVRVARDRGLDPMAVTMRPHPREVLTGERMPLLTTHDEKMALMRDAGIERVETLRFTHGLAAMSARDFIRDVLKPLDVEVLVMGYDHCFGHDGHTATFDDFVRWGEETGVEVVLAHELDRTGVSSSSVRRALSVGDVAGAANMLGRGYTVGGTVVGGKRIGREMGFPTANLRADERKMLPGEGVYATLVRVDGEMRGAMTNIGCRPTVDDESRQTVETHIFDFDGDLYGKRLELEFVKKIRDIQMFDGRDKLAAQLARDAAVAESILLKPHTPH